MKKITLLALVLCFNFTSCNQKQEAPVITESNLKQDQTNTLEGTWKLVYAETREKDSVEIKDLSKSEFVKIINKTHFTFINQNISDDQNFYAGGGEYKLEGNNYTEKLTYTSIVDYRGHDFSFEVQIKGDTLIQQGVEEIKEKNIKKYIIEKYIKL